MITTDDTLDPAVLDQCLCELPQLPNFSERTATQKAAPQHWAVKLAEDKFADLDVCFG